jgi:hypothetical protein
MEWIHATNLHAPWLLKDYERRKKEMSKRRREVTRFVSSVVILHQTFHLKKKKKKKKEKSTADLSLRLRYLMLLSISQKSKGKK